MYTLPQEIEVWYIIPAIRKKLASCLIMDHKATYKKVGDILGVTKAAVSQYLSNKRAGKIFLPKEIDKEIMKSCSVLLKDKSNSVREIDRILKIIIKKDLPCRVCKESMGGNLKDCKEIRIKRDYIKRWNLG